MGNKNSINRKISFNGKKYHLIDGKVHLMMGKNHSFKNGKKAYNKVG